MTDSCTSLTYLHHYHTNFTYIPTPPIHKLQVPLQSLHDSHPESLPGAGLCDAHKVSATEGHGPALGLDGGRLHEALSIQSREDIVGKICLPKRKHRLRDILSLHKHCLVIPVPLDFILQRQSERCKKYAHQIHINKFGNTKHKPLP